MTDDDLREANARNYTADPGLDPMPPHDLLAHFASAAMTVLMARADRPDRTPASTSEIAAAAWAMAQAMVAARPGAMPQAASEVRVPPVRPGGRRP